MVVSSRQLFADKSASTMEITGDQGKLLAPRVFTRRPLVLKQLTIGKETQTKTGTSAEKDLR